MAKLKDLETAQANAPAAPAEPVKNEKVEAAVRAFEASMKNEGKEVPEAQALKEDELHACALMSARHFSDADSQSILQRFISVDGQLSAGEASKTLVFKSIAACLKSLQEQDLLDFSKAGGFGLDSRIALSPDMVR